MADFLDFIFGGSEQESQQTSASQSRQLQEQMQAKAPLTPQEVRDYYEWAKSAAGAEPTGGMAPFQWEGLGSSPTFQGPGDSSAAGVGLVSAQAAPGSRSLTGGDYNRLEEQLSAVPERRMMEERDTARSRFLADMRKRGVADDPAFFQLGEEEIEQPYRESLGDIYSGAAGQRYGLEAEELARLGTEDVNKYGIGINYATNLNQNLSQLYGIGETAKSNLNAANLGAFNTQATATGAENAGRLGYNLESYNAPRQFWLDKMKSYYTGAGEKAIGASRSTSATDASGAGTSSGESTPGLASMFKFSF